MPVLVSNLQEEAPVSDELVKIVERVVRETLVSEKYDAGAEVSLVFVDDPYIQSLNTEYRGIDRPTDVLSFAMLEGEELAAAGDEEVVLGDIVISLPTAKRQAVEYAHSLEREVGFLTAHGCLHLLGYDHQTDADRQIMREKEEAVLARLNLTR